MLATGGINAGNVAEYLAAGASAVGVGGELVDAAALARGESSVLTDRARALVSAVKNARARR
jgi:2-dehydro-3-deoxyphosphogluconate aldolase/(4S)-4-hydroxy-2-oxoglutarate aldolase